MLEPRKVSEMDRSVSYNIRPESLPHFVFLEFLNPFDKPICTVRPRIVEKEKENSNLNGVALDYYT